MAVIADTRVYGWDQAHDSQLVLSARAVRQASEDAMDGDKPYLVDKIMGYWWYNQTFHAWLTGDTEVEA